MKHPGKIARQLIDSLFKKPATQNYPADKSGMPKGFRGKLSFNAQACINCKMCVRDCPTGAIEIKKIDEKTYEAHVDLAKCIYCGQCVDSCPKKALGITSQFELARLKSGDLKVIIHAEPEDHPKK